MKVARSLAEVAERIKVNTLSRVRCEAQASNGAIHTGVTADIDWTPGPFVVTRNGIDFGTRRWGAADTRTKRSMAPLAPAARLLAPMGWCGFSAARAHHHFKG